MIEPHLVKAEQARVRSKPTESFHAYGCVLHAFSRLYTFNERHFTEAGAFLDRAIQLDPLYAQAHAYKAIWHVLQIGEGRAIERRRDAASAEAAAQRAIQLDPDDAVALAI